MNALRSVYIEVAVGALAEKIQKAVLLVVGARREREVLPGVITTAGDGLRLDVEFIALAANFTAEPEGIEPWRWHRIGKCRGR